MAEFTENLPPAHVNAGLFAMKKGAFGNPETADEIKEILISSSKQDNMVELVKNLATVAGSNFLKMSQSQPQSVVKNRSDGRLERFKSTRDF